jgi:hypothetical protein
MYGFIRIKKGAAKAAHPDQNRMYGFSRTEMLSKSKL